MEDSYYTENLFNLCRFYFDSNNPDDPITRVEFRDNIQLRNGRILQWNFASVREPTELQLRSTNIQQFETWVNSKRLEDRESKIDPLIRRIVNALLERIDPSITNAEKRNFLRNLLTQ